MILSAASVRNSLILVLKIWEPSCLATRFMWSHEALQSDSSFWRLADRTSKSTLDARITGPTWNIESKRYDSDQIIPIFIFLLFAI